jgi:hypothetical protein
VRHFGILGEACARALEAPLTARAVSRKVRLPRTVSRMVRLSRKNGPEAQTGGLQSHQC